MSRLSALGDVVCTLPVASAIKDAWPDSEIVWMVDRRFRGILECCSAVDTIVERPSRLREVRQLGEFDAALDMQGLFKSGVLIAAARAKRKVGYHWQREGAWLFSQRVFPDPSSIHIVDQYVDVARAIGAKADAATFALTPVDEDVDAVRARLGEAGWDGRALVVCNAGAGWASKRWPAQKYSELTKRLIQLGLAVAFIGASADRPAFEEVLACGAEGALDMIGKTSVRELVALVSAAIAHVGGDTGSTHIAAALGKTAVGIYTLTRPERSCPYGQVHNCLSAQERPVEVEEVLGKLEAAGVFGH
ncbi:MAG: glycosyltransferase family 9 protein [Armatimonadetes bacterium]|nr:glycosyltransferase family 9 protein [Armatimonadota bacterium]